MNGKIKKIILVIILVVILGGIGYLCFNINKEETVDNGKLNIVVTNFSTYDFAKQTGGDEVNVSNLLDPGVDSHSYEPTASDIIEIQNADIFIYIGGESETWAEEVVDTLGEFDVRLMCITEYVELSEEMEIEAAEEEEHDHEDEEEEVGEFDEHIWTSPTKAIELAEAIKDIMIEENEENKDLYETNLSAYVAEIEELKVEIQEIVDNSQRTKLVFGDRMPMQYFIQEFDLDVAAAFAGCSTEIEPSTATIASLVKIVEEEDIPVVLYIELSDGTIANTIANETGATAMQIQTMHNVSKTDFENGETYVSLMTRNLEVLKAALQ